MKSNHPGFDWKSFISDHPLFGELTTNDINSLLDSGNSTQRTFKRDEVIFRAGEISSSFFLIGDGSVNVELSSEDSSATNICTLYKGDYFGEMSAIDDHSGRAATIMANEDCTLLEIKGSSFQKVIKKSPELEFKLLSMLADRLRHVNDHLLKSTRLSYDTKFSLLSEKIKSQSKVVEASLKASQAVFEQTKIRTTEIIDAAERGRSRITWVMSTLTAGFTLLLALFSFLGYDKLNTAEQKLEKIEAARLSIEATKDEVEEARRYVTDARKNADDLAAAVASVTDTITTLQKSISESENAKRILFETLIPVFSVQVEDKIKTGTGSEPGFLGLKILEINDDPVTVKFFKEIFFMIDTSHQDILDNIAELNESKLEQEEMSELLEENKLNRARISYCTSFMYLYVYAGNGNQAENPLADFLSRYILLLTYAMNDQYAKDLDVYHEINASKYPRDSFDNRLKEIQRKYSGVDRNGIIKQLGQEFISDLKSIKLAENEQADERRISIFEILAYSN